MWRRWFCWSGPARRRSTAETKIEKDGKKGSEFMPYFVTEDNCKLYYEEHGQGRPVIFIHGWGCNRHYFKKQYPAFEKHFKVLR